MKNTVPIIIKTYLIAGCFYFFGCSSSTNSSEGSPSTKKEVHKLHEAQIKKKAKPAKIVTLTDENVEKELLNYGKNNTETLVLMKTPKGNMTIKLFQNTPLHRANFIRLIKNNFYKGTVFYRVVNDFMIQGGDNDDWSRQSIKDKMGNYTLPAEFRAENIHKKGALSMAREYENNPEMRSVSFEFFIVQGTKYTEAELRGAELQYGLKISPKHKEIYEAVGGTPHLDGKHTVFGQVIDGLNIIDSIASVAVDEGDWPIEDITMEFHILK